MTLLAAAPIFVSLATLFAVLIADMFSRKVAVAVGVGGLLVAAGFGFYSVYAVTQIVSIGRVMVGGGGYSAAPALVCALSALALLGGWHWYVESRRGGAAAALVVLLAAASAALSATVDVVFLLIVLEILAVCGYALVGQAGTSRAAEASVKYVIQGSVATGLLVMALAILLGINGSVTDVFLVAESLTREFAAQTMLVASLFLAAYAYKLGAFPFHSWAPDAFETAPAPSAAALASAPKIAAIISMFIIFFRAFGRTFTTIDSAGYVEFASVCAALAAASILFGNFVALRQSSYTRMLGYSGIAQVGYALVGLAVVAGDPVREAGGSNLGLVFPSTGVLISAYGLAVVGAFLVAEAVRRKRPGWDGSLAGMAGIGRDSSALGLGTAVLMFSMTGIPLTAGFWGKLGVFGAAAEQGWVWLALVGVLGSVVSFGYYGNVLKVMYLDDSPSGSGSGTEGGRAAVLVVVLCAVLVLAIGIAPLFTGVAPLFRFFAF